MGRELGQPNFPIEEAWRGLCGARGYLARSASAGHAEPGAVALVPIESLIAIDSPRTRVNPDHVRALAEVGQDLPPIVVHRATMRVIDGAHRLAAARLAGRSLVEIRFFDGDEAAAFVLAVQANVTHGLPLSLAERTAAATRIVRSYPQWSDRAIAGAAGLSPKTVAAIRTRSSEEIPHLPTRVGRDGRVRTVNSRPPRRAAPLLDEAGPEPDPGAGAATTRPSAGAPSRTDDEDSLWTDPSRILAGGDPMSAVRELSRDPALRLNENGRTLLRMLHLNSLSRQDWERIVTSLPPHCRPRVADVAAAYASAWQQFAERVRQH